jgi:carboxypeptidase Q
VGQGAMDDGGGALCAWESVQLMRLLGTRPRRTARVVRWTNEENGLAGARGYERAHQSGVADAPSALPRVVKKPAAEK